MENTNNVLSVNLSNDSSVEKFLSFYTFGVEYAINIKYVTDIVNFQPITFLPRLPDYIKGIINLRGKIVPVIDMRARFGREICEYTEEACIIVMEHDNVTVGILVDAVAEVTDIKLSDIMIPPRHFNSENNRYVNGISNNNGNVKLIIDCMQLFEVE